MTHPAPTYQAAVELLTACGREPDPGTATRLVEHWMAPQPGDRYLCWLRLVRSGQVPTARAIAGEVENLARAAARQQRHRVAQQRHAARARVR